jgi:hypothetical protein
MEAPQSGHPAEDRAQDRCHVMLRKYGGRRLGHAGAKRCAATSRWSPLPPASPDSTLSAVGRTLTRRLRRRPLPQPGEAEMGLLGGPD